MGMRIVQKYFCMVVVILIISTGAVMNTVSDQDMDQKSDVDNDQLESNEIKYISQEEDQYEKDLNDLGFEFIPPEQMSVELKEILDKYTIEELGPSMIKYLIQFIYQRLIKVV